MEKKKKKLHVIIGDPYLTLPIDSLRHRVFDKLKVGAYGHTQMLFLDDVFQMELESHGIDSSNPRNFSGVEKIITPQHEITLNMPGRYFIKNFELASLLITSKEGLVDGMAPSLRDRGIIVAHYWNGRTPLDGYSLVIPSNFGLTESLIKDDNILHSLSIRDEQEIKNALERFNKENKGKVIATPCLSKALSIKK